MKKIIIFISACLLLASCADFTDLKPKGMNMLSSADELELLLNTEFRDFNRIFDFYQLPGDVLPAPVGNIANLLSMPTPSRNSILVSWDESNIRRLAELTSSDDDYTKLFGFVGQIANPILASVSFATGDANKVKQIQAEALCLRAWAQFLLVNKYAAAYNPATAENTPGIPYLMEDWDISIPPEKWTVKQVYDQIIADCDAAIETDALPVKNINQMRWSKACHGTHGHAGIRGRRDCRQGGHPDQRGHQQLLVTCLDGLAYALYAADGSLPVCQPLALLLRRGPLPYLY